MSKASETHRLLKPIDQGAFSLLEDRTRRRMLLLLRESELSAKEIALRLGMTPQNVYHHLKRMIEAGLVVEVRERRSGHMIESFYTTTADTFVYHEDDIPENDNHRFVEVLNGLNELGAGVRVSEENARLLSELAAEKAGLQGNPMLADDVCAFCGSSGYFTKFGPMDPTLLTKILKYNGIMNMSDDEFEKSLMNVRKLRRQLLSMKAS